MKLYLHIGNHKTGSTTIQGNLHKSKEVLLRKYGILYPDTALLKGAHHLFPSTVLGKTELFSEQIESNYLELLELLKNEISQKNPETVVISSEMFFLFTKKEISKLDILFSMFNEINIIVYLRNQIDQFESTYKFNILWKESREKNDFSSFLSRQTNSQYHFYDKKLRIWKNIFPKSNIIVKNFNDEIKKGFLNNFYKSVLDIGHNVVEVKANASLSRLSSLLLRAANSEQITLDDRNNYIELLTKLDKKYLHAKKERLYSEVQYKFIVEKYSGSNESLKQEFNVDLNQHIKKINQVELLGDNITGTDLVLFMKTLIMLGKKKEE